MKIIDPEIKRFLDIFLNDRAINKEFYKRVPEDKLDFHMVDRPERKSDSPRQSIAHQVYVTRKYIYGVKTGTLKFDGIVEKPLLRSEIMSKKELLDELEETEKELIALLNDPTTAKKVVTVPWSKDPVPAIVSLWGLQSHEVLHIGWNLAVMDHLNIERFSLLKQTWG